MKKLFFEVRKIFSYKFILVLLSLFLLGSAAGYAAMGDNVSGYAWSSNIGWIKLNNCTDPTDSSTCSGPDFGVNFSSTAPGTGSGHGWSDNIGWISFNAGPVGDCPPSPGFSQCGPYIDWSNPNADGSLNLKGWARACSVLDSADCTGITLKDPSVTGGWDGFIALSDPSGAGAWGVKVNGGTISGFAWGGDVVGWVDFNSATFGGGGGIPVDPSITVDLTANPLFVRSGEFTNLTWTSSSTLGLPIACAGTNFNGNASSGSTDVSVTATTTYTIECTDGINTVTDSETVTVLTITDGIPSFTSNGCVSPNTRPKLSWETHPSVQSCVIKRSGAANQSVPTNTTDFQPNAVVNVNPTTYTLDCSDGAGSTYYRTTDVAWCFVAVPDYTISLTPEKQPLINGVDGAGNPIKMAVFNIAVNPTAGFGTSGETVSLSHILPSMPSSTQATFSDSSLSYSGSGFETATLTITVDAAEAIGNPEWLITVVGTSGTLSRSDTALITEKRSIIFEEF